MNISDNILLDGAALYAEYFYMQNIFILSCIISTDSPGYLLVSEVNDVSYFFTVPALLERSAVTPQSLISASGVSGNLHT